MLYIKKNIDISDFLKIIGANESMQQWEEKIISRDYYNNVNKLNNLDIANLRKTSSAGVEQVKMINVIRKTRIFKSQPDKFRFYCSLRLQHPEAPLSEMVDIFMNKYRIKITRTGINHYVLKIRRIFRNLK
jgi:DNA-binding protein WhiA